MATCTLSYTDANGVTTSVSVRVPEWGNADRMDPMQEQTRTLGGLVLTYDRGARFRTFDFQWYYLSATERADLERFFHDLVEYGKRWWTLSWACPWPEPLRAGASVGGVVVTAGSAYTAGQRVVQSSASAWRVRLMAPGLLFTEPEDGHYDLGLQLHVISGTLPDNC